jgi:hypothetical protein
MKQVHFRAKLLAATSAALLFAGPAHALPINFVPNGNFEAGNTLFTSDYTFNPASNTAEGQYTVRTNPFPWNPEFISTGDHTSGTGMMMVANGSPVSGAVVWRSGSIAVTAATNYFFEAFVNNVCCQHLNFGPGSESILEFSLSLNGAAPVSLGTITTKLSLAGTWEGLSTQFLANSAGTVVLSLINRNTNAGGNDFAIDDVFFGTQSTVAALPEPLTLSLLGVALAGLGVSRRKRVKT